MNSAEPGSLAVVGPAPALDDHSLARLAEMVAKLAGDEYAGRRIGTAGSRAARDWLAQQLQKAGARVHTEAFTATGILDLYATPVLDWTADAPTRRLVHRRDFAEHLASADLPTRVEAPLAAVGNPQLRGRWLLAPAYNPDTVEVAQAGGAVGLLVPRGADDEGWMPKMIAGPPTGPLPTLSVRTKLHGAMLTATRGVAHVRASVPLRTVEATGATLIAATRLVISTVWHLAAARASLSSSIGDKR